jgi:hypothetical protein
LLIAFVADAAGATYYLSPTGSNSNPGTSSAPWKTFAFAVTQLQAGDTLLLRDGTYTRANSGMLSVDCRINANGTSASPITIQAENERRAFLSGDGTVKPINVMYCSYWRFVGIRAKSADSVGGAGGVMQVYQSDYITVRRMLLEHPNRYVNDHALLLWSDSGSHGNHLVEENEVYDAFRHGILTKYESNSVFRRNYINSRESVDAVGGTLSGFAGRGDTGIAIYPGSNHIVENNISEGQGIGFNIEADGTTVGNRFYGNISLADVLGLGFVARGTTLQTMPRDTIVNNHVIVNPAGAAVSLRANKNTQVNGLSVFGSGANGVSADLSSVPGDGAPTVFISNTLVVPARSSYDFYFERQASFQCNYCAGTGTFMPDVLDYRVTNEFTKAPTNLGTNKVVIPGASNLKAAGLGGADIGANVVYRHQNGTVTSQLLWDATSGAFPCGAIVAGVNDIKGSSCFDVHVRLGVTPSTLPINTRSSASPTITAPGNVQVQVTP